MKLNIPSFIAVVFFSLIKSQFTTNTQNILHLNQCTSSHVLSWNVALFETSRGACELFDRRQECFSELSLHFELQLNALEFGLSVPADISLKDWRRMNVAAVPRKLCAVTYRCKYFFSILCGENKMEKVICFEFHIIFWVFLNQIAGRIAIVEEPHFVHQWSTHYANSVSD